MLSHRLRTASATDNVVCVRACYGCRGTRCVAGEVAWTASGAILSYWSWRLWQVVGHEVRSDELMKVKQLVRVCGVMGGVLVVFAAAGCEIEDYFTPVAHDCGHDLGQCPDGEFCQYDVGSCGAEGTYGTCTSIREAGVCAQLYAPVCGCDGITYYNSCESESAGVSIASEGECPETEGD